MSNKINLDAIKKYFEFQDIGFEVTIRKNERIADVNTTASNFIFLLESNKRNSAMIPYYNTLLEIYKECKKIKP